MGLTGGRASGSNADMDFFLGMIVLAVAAAIVLVALSLRKIELTVTVVVPKVDVVVDGGCTVTPDSRLLDAMSYAENALTKMQEEAREARERRLAQLTKEREESIAGKDTPPHRRARLRTPE